MGSFSMTCSVSGLGIPAGTPVRCLLLTESPYVHDDPRKPWIVRAPPLRARYNDYGSIEDVHADDDFIKKLWLRGLREDVVERGLGDNSCHDVPVAIDMSFPEMLTAIQEHRLQVSQDALHFWMQPRHGPGSDDLGSLLMRRVEELLESKFPGRVSKQAAKDTYVVDEPVPHMARVRFGEYQYGAECTSALEAARVVIERPELPTKLTGVVVAGSGRYPENADLLVFPLPASTDDHVTGPQWDKAAGQSANDNKILSVGLAMIREDVWQELIAYPQCDRISLACVECGQSPSYHKKDWSCPTESINGNPYKEHAKGAKYAHGSVFPAGVPHVIEPREWSEYVWYGIDAYKWGTRSTWASVLEGVARRNKHSSAVSSKKDYPFFGDFRISPADVHDFRMPGAWVFHDAVPGVIGVSEHLSMLFADRVEVPESLLDAVAELSAVRCVLGGVGVVLSPAVASGPQSPEWSENTRFARLVLRIAESACNDRTDEMQEPAATLDEAFEIMARKVKSQQARRKVKSQQARRKVKSQQARTM